METTSRMVTRRMKDEVRLASLSDLLDEFGLICGVFLNGFLEGGEFVFEAAEGTFLFAGVEGEGAVIGLEAGDRFFERLEIHCVQGRLSADWMAAETTLPSSSGSILPTRGRTVLAMPMARSNLLGFPAGGWAASAVEPGQELLGRERGFPSEGFGAERRGTRSAHRLSGCAEMGRTSASGLS